MIIAQNSINIDENAKLANEANDKASNVQSNLDKQSNAFDEKIRFINTSNTERDNIIAQAKKQLMDKLGDMNQVNETIKQQLADNNSSLSKRLDGLQQDTQKSIDQQNALIKQNNDVRDKLIQKTKDELTKQLGSSEQAQKVVTDELNDKQSELSRVIEMNKEETQKKIDALSGNVASVQTVAHGRSVVSQSSPNNSDDTNNHVTGDVWTQYTTMKDSNGNVQIDDNGQPKRVAVAQFIFDETIGKWVEQKWDAQSMNIQTLSALTADLGDVTAGNITGVNINGGNLTGTTISSPFSEANVGSDWGYHQSTWDSSDYVDSDGKTAGFHLTNGLMKMVGQRTAQSDDYVGMWDFTFIGPNDIKVRRSDTNNTKKEHMSDRVDIHSNGIEIADKYAKPGKSNSNGVGFYSNGTATITDTLHLGKLETDTITNLTSKKEVSFPNGIDLQYAKSYEYGKGITLDGNVYVTRSVFPNNAGITSDLSKKNIIRSVDSKQSLAEVLGTDTYKYHYKGDNDLTNVGPVIDDINGIKDSHYNISKYMVTDNGKGGHAFALQNAVGLLIGSVHELSKQNEKLLSRIVKLEAQNNGNN